MDDLEAAFSYMEILCSSIEEFTKDERLKNPQAFTYRNSDLGYAFERDLYFRFLDHELLFDFFRSMETKGVVQRFQFPDDLTRTLAFYFFQKRLPLGDFKVSPPRGRLFRFLHSIKRGLNQALMQKSISRPSGQPTQEATRPDVLFYINSDRFIPFLSPIIKGMPVKSAFLNPTGQLCETLQRHQYDAVHFRSPEKIRSDKESPSILGHLAYEYDRYWDILNDIRPKLVVVLEGCAPADELINKASRSLSIPCACVQHGWDSTIRTGFRNCSFSKMLMWGDGFSNLLKPYNPEQKFVSVGNHMLGSLNEEEHHIPPSKRNAVSFFLQTVNRMIPQKAWDQFLSLIKWTASQHRDVTVLLREHPRYPLDPQERTTLSQFTNIEFVPSKSHTLKSVLDRSRFSVVMYSSTIFESIGAGVPSLLFNVSRVPYYIPDIHQLGVGVEVKDLSSAQKEVSDLVRSEQRMNSFKRPIEDFQRNYFNISVDDPVRAIVDEFMALMTSQKSVTQPN